MYCTSYQCKYLKLKYMFADNKIGVFLEMFASWHKQFNSLLGGAIRLLFVMIFLRAFLFQGICSFDCDIYMCTWANATLFVGGCGATSASSREHHEFTDNSFNDTLCNKRSCWILDFKEEVNSPRSDLEPLL